MRLNVPELPVPSCEQVSPQTFQLSYDGFFRVHDKPVQPEGIGIKPPFLPELSVQELLFQFRCGFIPHLILKLPVPGIAVGLVEMRRAAGRPF